MRLLLQRQKIRTRSVRVKLSECVTRRPEVKGKAEGSRENEKDQKAFNRPAIL